MWVEFVVGSLLSSERFFSGYSGFPLSSKTNISKFQFDLDVRHFSHEPLARVIAQALPVLDVIFTFTFSSDSSDSSGSSVLKEPHMAYRKSFFEGFVVRSLIASPLIKVGGKRNSLHIEWSRSACSELRFWCFVS